MRKMVWLAALIAAMSVTMVQADYFNERVAASTDDAYNSAGFPCGFDDSSTSFSRAFVSQNRGGFCWSGVTIPQNSTINSANFTAYYTITVNGGTSQIHGVLDSLHASEFTWVEDETEPDSCGSFGVTTGVINANQSITANGNYAIDITQVLQELVNNETWQSGNVICITEEPSAFGGKTSGYNVFTKDYNVFPPKPINLTVYYTEPYVDTTPPVLSNIEATNTSYYQTKINWTTDENSNSTVVYGTMTQETQDLADDGIIITATSATNKGYNITPDFDIYLESINFTSNVGASRAYLTYDNHTMIKNVTIRSEGSNKVAYFNEILTDNNNYYLLIDTPDGSFEHKYCVVCASYPYDYTPFNVNGYVTDWVSSSGSNILSRGFLDVKYQNLTGLFTIVGRNASNINDTNHSIWLHNLDHATIYLYNITSCDVLNNCNQSDTYYFKTLDKCQYYGTGDWNINENCSIYDYETTVNGNLIIQNDYTQTFQMNDSIITFATDVGSEYNIEIGSTTTFNMETNTMSSDYLTIMYLNDTAEQYLTDNILTNVWVVADGLNAKTIQLNRFHSNTTMLTANNFDNGAIYFNLFNLTGSQNDQQYIINLTNCNNLNFTDNNFSSINNSYNFVHLYECDSVNLSYNNFNTDQELHNAFILNETNYTRVYENNLTATNGTIRAISILNGQSNFIYNNTIQCQSDCIYNDYYSYTEMISTNNLTGVYNWSHNFITTSYAVEILNNSINKATNTKWCTNETDYNSNEVTIHDYYLLPSEDFFFFDFVEFYNTVVWCPSVNTSLGAMIDWETDALVVSTGGDPLTNTEVNWSDPVNGQIGSETTGADGYTAKHYWRYTKITDNYLSQVNISYKPIIVNASVNGTIIYNSTSIEAIQTLILYYEKALTPWEYEKNVTMIYLTQLPQLPNDKPKDEEFAPLFVVGCCLGAYFVTRRKNEEESNDD